MVTILTTILTLVILAAWLIIFLLRQESEETANRLMAELARAYGRISELETRLERRERKAPYREVIIIPMATAAPALELNEYIRN